MVSPPLPRSRITWRRWESAGYFDIEWDSPEAKLRNIVLLPVLGDHYGRVLESGELHLEREEGCFVICYHDQVFPVSPRSLNDLLATAWGKREITVVPRLVINLGGTWADTVLEVPEGRWHDVFADEKLNGGGYRWLSYCTDSPSLCYARNEIREIFLNCEAHRSFRRTRDDLA